MNYSPSSPFKLSDPSTAKMVVLTLPLMSVMTKWITQSISMTSKIGKKGVLEQEKIYNLRKTTYLRT